MTTQKITRDKLVQAISELESWEEFQLQAYKELLAAMDSDPVHICHDTREFLAGLINDALCQDNPTELDNQFAADIEKLLQPVYSVRPAAIQVPDHMEMIEKGRLWLLERAYRTLLDYRADNLWYWQGDEDDQPEILSCPVIMSAETLRELLAKSAPPAPVAVPGHADCCPECGSKSLTWDVAVAKTSDVVQGRLRTSDVTGMFFLGCDECSETVSNVRMEDIAIFLNSYRAAMLKAGPVTAATVPDGWKIVPLIASPSQWAAGQKAFNSAGINKVDAVYKAMVLEAPTPEEHNANA